MRSSILFTVVSLLASVVAQDTPVADVEKRAALPNKYSLIAERELARAAATRKLRRSQTLESRSPIAFESENEELSSLQKRALARDVTKIYCGRSDYACTKNPQPYDAPSGGRVACNTNTLRCEKRCPYGTTLKYNVCIANAETCGLGTCPPKPKSGSFKCKSGACTLICLSGWDVNTLGTAGTYCIDVKNDINNCGSEGNVCPISYNSSGPRSCSNGVCGLNCPAWHTLKFTSAKKLPYCQPW